MEEVRDWDRDRDRQHLVVEKKIVLIFGNNFEIAGSFLYFFVPMGKEGKAMIPNLEIKE